MTNQISISNVIEVSVQEPGAGLGSYNTSNLGLLTREQPGSPFTSGFKIYLEPSEVEDDFGTDSLTYAMALKVFSQNPNIKAGGGYLVVMPMTPGTIAVQNVDPSATPDEGSFKLNWGGNVTAALGFGATAAQVQAALRALPGLEYVTVTGSMATSFDVNFIGVNGVVALVTVSDNTLEASNVGVTFTIATTTPGVAGETMAAAITRTKAIVQYFGVMCAELAVEAELTAAAAVLQALPTKIGFFVSNLSSSYAAEGMFDDVAVAGLSHSRCLYYGSTIKQALEFMASYASNGLSTNFSGTNTTRTMQLKDMIGMLPDPTIDQNGVTACKAAGVDIYASVQGIPKLLTSGANKFFDQVYNLAWFVGALEVAYFNLLAQVSTKIPQTEQGMDQVKGSLGTVCEQAITNQYGSPGVWTSPVTFGSLEKFHENIRQRGYYIYSAPIGSQLPADRADRKAPIVQIALKEAGAIHSGSVIVNINP